MNLPYYAFVIRDTHENEFHIDFSIRDGFYEGDEAALVASIKTFMQSLDGNNGESIVFSSFEQHTETVTSV